MRFVFDSDLNRPEHNSHANYRLHIEPVGVPETMVKSFRVEISHDTGRMGDAGPGRE